MVTSDFAECESAGERRYTVLTKLPAARGRALYFVAPRPREYRI